MCEEGENIKKNKRDPSFNREMRGLNRKKNFDSSVSQFWNALIVIHENNEIVFSNLMNQNLNSMNHNKMNKRFIN